uniref:Uncharacterized protein n=1 Tax=Knipowitschia caucasica TaxID=637954 RepID=A0AAV2JTX6_KNICA
MKPDATAPEAQSQPLKQTESKTRPPVKREKWKEEEVCAVEKHLMSFITTCRVPGKKDCDKCLQNEKEALKTRDCSEV